MFSVHANAEFRYPAHYYKQTIHCINGTQYFYSSSGAFSSQLIPFIKNGVIQTCADKVRLCVDRGFMSCEKEILIDRIDIDKYICASWRKNAERTKNISCLRWQSKKERKKKAMQNIKRMFPEYEQKI